MSDEWTPAKAARAKAKDEEVFSGEDVFPSVREFLQSRKNAAPHPPQVLDETPRGLQQLKLHDYQLAGLNWLLDHHRLRINCILGDEMGLGKTIQTVALLTHLKHSGGSHGPFLVVSPLSVIHNWLEHFKRFSPGLEVHEFTGSKIARDRFERAVEQAVMKQPREQRKDPILPFHVLVTTYDLALRSSAFLRKFDWRAIVVDEGHRLKNPASVLSSVLVQFTARFRVLLTGTPCQNNVQEVWGLLHFLHPKLFPHTGPMGFKAFSSRFSPLQQQSAVGPAPVPEQDSELVSFLTQELQSVLKPFLLRRVKDEVTLTLPEKREVIIYTGMSALQKRLYRSILSKNLGELAEENNRALVNVIASLRKASAHPYLFVGAEPEPFEEGPHLYENSGKLFVLDRLLTRLKAMNRRVLIFAQSVQLLDILQDYLALRRHSYERLDGSVRGEERALALQNFKQTNTFVFLLSTRAGGVGLNLAAADTVIFMESDWNPQMDLQAENRVHRIGQRNPVLVLRLVASDTIDEVIFRRAQRKLQLTQRVLGKGKKDASTEEDDRLTQPADELKRMLQFGLDRLWDEDREVDMAEAVEKQVERLFDLHAPFFRGEEVELPATTDAVGASGKDAVLSFELMEMTQEAENLYSFEGVDYKEDADIYGGEERVEGCNAALKALQETVRTQRKQREQQAKDARALLLQSRRRGGKGVVDVADSPVSPPNRAEQERRRKARLEASRVRLAARWDKHSYVSARAGPLKPEPRVGPKVVKIAATPSLNEDEEADGVAAAAASSVPLQFVSGDASHPEKCLDLLPDATDECKGEAAVVLCCVDDSGKWGRGGFFDAVHRVAPAASEQYELAGQMKDLRLGDAHMVRVNTSTCDGGMKELYVAVLVTQKRTVHRGGRSFSVSGVQVEALKTACCSVAHFIEEEEKKAGLRFSVHTPRLGAGMPGYNWYAVERVLRRYFCGAGVQTLVYYFKRAPRPRSPSSDKSDVKSDVESEVDESMSNSEAEVASSESESEEEVQTTPKTKKLPEAAKKLVPTKPKAAKHHLPQKKPEAKKAVCDVASAHIPKLVAPFHATFEGLSFVLSSKLLPRHRLELERQLLAHGAEAVEQEGCSRYTRWWLFVTPHNPTRIQDRSVEWVVNCILAKKVLPKKKDEVAVKKRKLAVEQDLEEKNPKKRKTSEKSDVREPENPPSMRRQPSMFAERAEVAATVSRVDEPSRALLKGHCFYVYLKVSPSFAKDLRRTILQHGGDVTNVLTTTMDTVLTDARTVDSHLMYVRRHFARARDRMFQTEWLDAVVRENAIPPSDKFRVQ